MVPTDEQLRVSPLEGPYKGVVSDYLNRVANARANLESGMALLPLLQRNMSDLLPKIFRVQMKPMDDFISHYDDNIKAPMVTLRDRVKKINRADIPTSAADLVPFVTSRLDYQLSQSNASIMEMLFCDPRMFAKKGKRAFLSYNASDVMARIRGRYKLDSDEVDAAGKLRDFIRVRPDRVFRFYDFEKTEFQNYLAGGLPNDLRKNKPAENLMWLQNRTSPNYYGLDGIQIQFASEGGQVRLPTDYIFKPGELFVEKGLAEVLMAVKRLPHNFLNRNPIGI